MPLIDLDGDLIQSSAPVAGTNYATCLALSDNARANSIKVGIGFAEILTRNNPGIIWTDSLQSCFPVVFKFKNGDIALYHGNNASVDDISRSSPDLPPCSIGSLLRRADLVEIQLFEKSDKNAEKVGGFVRSVGRFCEENNLPQPIMNLKDTRDSYNAAVCYKSSDGEPVIIIGASQDSGSLVKTLELCTNISDGDHITPCQFVSAIDRYPPIAMQAQFSFKREMTQGRAIELDEVQMKIDASSEKPEETQSCCTIQ